MKHYEIWPGRFGLGQVCGLVVRSVPKERVSNQRPPILRDAAPLRSAAPQDEAEEKTGRHLRLVPEVRARTTRGNYKQRG